MTTARIASALALALLACGPSSSESTPEGSSETTSGAETTTEHGSTTDPSTTPSDPESTGEHETSTTSTPSAESSSGTTSGCFCTSVSLALDEPTPEGFSFVDLVAAIPEVEMPWVWTGVDGMPTTTVRMSFEVRRGQASWEENSCGTVESCRDLFGPATLVISTDDGMLDDRLDGHLRGIPDEQVQADIDPIALDSFMGTLPDAMFVDGTGAPLVVEEAGLRGLWTWDGENLDVEARLAVPLVNDAIVLGETTE